GSHTVELDATDINGTTLFSKTQTITTVAYAPGTELFTLDYAVGGIDLGWTLTTGGFADTCSGAAFPTIYVNFQQSGAGSFYYSSDNVQACSSGSATYALPAGAAGTVYDVSIYALHSPNYWYPATYPTLPQVTIMPGVFPL